MRIRRYCDASKAKITFFVVCLTVILCICRVLRNTDLPLQEHHSYIEFSCHNFSYFLVSCDMSGMSPGQRFMTDLLVSSLMADGGLELALEAAIKKETQGIEEKKVGKV